MIVNSNEDYEYPPVIDVDELEVNLHKSVRELTREVENSHQIDST